jgi:hypothetical protein
MVRSLAPKCSMQSLPVVAHFAHDITSQSGCDGGKEGEGDNSRQLQLEPTTTGGQLTRYQTLLPMPLGSGSITGDSMQLQPVTLTEGAKRM